MNGLESPEWGWNVKAETRVFLLLFAESRKLERVTVPHPDGPQGAGGFGESLSTGPFSPVTELCGSHGYGAVPK